MIELVDSSYIPFVLVFRLFQWKKKNSIHFMFNMKFLRLIFPPLFPTSTTTIVKMWSPRNPIWLTPPSSRNNEILFGSTIIGGCPEISIRGKLGNVDSLVRVLALLFREWFYVRLFDMDEVSRDPGVEWIKMRTF